MILSIIAIFFLYKNSDQTIQIFGFTLKKNSDLAFKEVKPIKKKRKIVVLKKQIELLKNKRILLAGDSEAGSIVYEIQKYAVLNGHNLCRTIIIFIKIILSIFKVPAPVCGPLITKSNSSIFVKSSYRLQRKIKA
jgi:hypothetical protein